MPPKGKKTGKKATEPVSDPEEIEEETKIPLGATKPSPKQIKALITSGIGDPALPKQLAKLLRKTDSTRRLVNALNKHVVEEVKTRVTGSEELIDWMKSVMDVISKELLDVKGGVRDCFFFPSKESETRLVEYLDTANKTMEICVFTMTNNTLRDAVQRAHDRGAVVRVISDDECLKMRGSDVYDLQAYGIPSRSDSNPHAHMHNKFVIIDNKLLISGSFNWTMQAVKSN
jgi:cardiolipin hydrolase